MIKWKCPYILCNLFLTSSLPLNLERLMKRDWLAGESFLCSDEVGVGAPTAEIVATLDAANLFSSLYVKHGDAAVQCCHRDLLAVRPVRHAERCNRTIITPTIMQQMRYAKRSIYSIIKHCHYWSLNLTIK